ncbi:MAG: rhodanese-like domain-containing protein [Lautropia sp.]|nr:rhodanese-like domain-containing protein [Lautropia sp.]
MNFISQNVFLILLALASGGMLLWQAVRGGGGVALGTLAATQLINQKHAQIADLRADRDFRAGHLPGARQITPDRVQTFAAGVGAETPILLVCASGAESAKAARALKGSGRSHVYSLQGGMDAWRQAGLPLVDQKS